jgi:Na+/H+ antiporter NhaD/arsenite permease-like protein
MVFLLIAVRQAGRFTFRIWQVMTAGAAVLLCTGEITPARALSAINVEVMVFLFGMFIVGEAVSGGGYLARVSEKVCRIARTRDSLLLVLIGVLAFSSAVLMNDTVAIIGTPLALSLASRYRIPPAAVLLTLCFALTTGSVFSPIGNPQNLLIATYWDPPDPFLAFAAGLLVPTMISLGLIFLCMRRRFQQEETGEYSFCTLPASGSDPNLALASRISLVILGVMILLRILGTPWGESARFSLGIIALMAAIPVLVLSRDRIALIRGVDWRTLIFFASMFILMQGVYDSGWFQESVPFQSLTTIPLLMATSILLSQFISNVPFIALFQPVISASGMSTGGMLSLAAGSTIAGNLTILGAASNVIVVQQAEKAGVHLSFRDFLVAGLPLTLLQGIVNTVWLMVFYK